MLFRVLLSYMRSKGKNDMRNHYEASEVIELGTAQDQILSQKRPDLTPVDNFGIANYSVAPIFDDFDE
jgi:hypothetical protein